MKLVALMPARNEEWILRLSARVALMWCDHLVLLDHASTDATPEIMAEVAAEHPARVTILTETDHTWSEMSHRQRLLDAGREEGGTHFALVDADEILVASALESVRDEVDGLLPGRMLSAPMWPIWGDLEHVRSDACVWTRSMLTLAFCDRGDLHWAQRDDGYEHHHRGPYGAEIPALQVTDLRVSVMHLQFADLRRLRAKHAHYKIQEILRWPGREPVWAVDRRYSQALDERGLQRRPCPAAWWEGYDRTQIDLGGEPWQESAVALLREQHGEEMLEGLELWGVGE